MQSCANLCTCEVHIKRKYLLIRLLLLQSIPFCHSLQIFRRHLPGYGRSPVSSFSQPSYIFSLSHHRNRNEVKTEPCVQSRLRLSGDNIIFCSEDALMPSVTQRLDVFFLLVHSLSILLFFLLLLRLPSDVARSCEETSNQVKQNTAKERAPPRGPKMKDRQGKTNKKKVGGRVGGLRYT